MQGAGTMQCKIKDCYYYKNIRAIVLIVVIGLLLFALGINISAESRVVRVGCVDTPNFMQADNDGKVWGYGVDYLEEIAKHTGWQYEYVMCTWSECLEKLKNGEIDLALPAQYTEERAEFYGYSKNQCCVDYVALFTRLDNDELYYNDWAGYNGIKVGMIENNILNDIFNEYCIKYNFDVERIYYNSSRALQNALTNGEVDAVVSGNFESPNYNKVLSKFEVTYAYIITNKENIKLLNQLDRAMENVLIEKPYFQENLYEKYYGGDYAMVNAYTVEEAEYIKNAGVLSIICDTHNIPTQYYNDDTDSAEGIYVDILKLISQKSGLKFDIKIADVEEGAWQAVKNKKADMIAGVNVTDKVAKEFGIRGSETYIVEENAIIGKKGMKYDLQSDLKVAIARNYVGIISNVKEKYPNWEIINYDNIYKCLEAVENNDADITLIDALSLQSQHMLKPYDDLGNISAEVLTVPISLGIIDEQPEVLDSVINKAIISIKQSELNECILNNTANVMYKQPFWILVKDNIKVVLLLICMILSFILALIKIKENKYKKMAMTDSLTGLWNREKFMEEAERELSQNKGIEYLIITIDVEKFKNINEAYGYKIGNIILRNIAMEMKDIFKKDALYARLMADSFVLMIRQDTEFYNNLMSTNKHRLKLDVFKGINVNIKAGVLRFVSGEKNNVAEYIDKANLAKKKIKGLHDESIKYYDIEIESQLKKENWIEANMDEALKNGEFKVYYQPKYLLNDNSLIGAEALVRWISYEKGIIPPDEFISIFERNCFIINLDFYVYEQVCQFLSSLYITGKSMVTISVNISRVHLDTPDFAEKFIELVERYNIPPKFIELELTESAMVKTNVSEVLSKLSDYGFLISIDDFGSGYSSLNLLKEISVDILKIDKGFLQESENSERSSAIIKKVVEIAKEMNMETICEGVETVEQAEFLKSIGCDMVQGYLYGKPMPLENFIKLLDR